jgi:hypothetical protein
MGPYKGNNTIQALIKMKRKIVAAIGKRNTPVFFPAVLEAKFRMASKTASATFCSPRGAILCFQRIAANNPIRIIDAAQHESSVFVMGSHPKTKSCSGAKCTLTSEVRLTPLKICGTRNLTAIPEAASKVAVSMSSKKMARALASLDDGIIAPFLLVLSTL